MTMKKLCIETAGPRSTIPNMITASEKQMGRYYDNDAALVAMPPSVNSLSISINQSSNEIEKRDASYCSNDTFSSKPVVAYKVYKVD